MSEPLPTDVQYWKSEAIWRGRLLKRLRDRLVLVKDGIWSDGDRTCFGSVNHTDEFVELVQVLDAFPWNGILREKKERDYITALRKANAKLRALRKALSLSVANGGGSL